MSRLTAFLFFSILYQGSLCADASQAYLFSNSPSYVYYPYDIATNTSSSPVTIPFAAEALGAQYPNLIYFGDTSGVVYSNQTSTENFSVVNSVAISAPLSSLSIAQNRIYATGSSSLYSVSLINGSVGQITPNPISVDGLFTIASNYTLGDPTLLYSEDLTNVVYKTEIATGTTTILTTLPTMASLSLLNNNTLLAQGFTGTDVVLYKINTQTGEFTTLTSSFSGSPANWGFIAASKDLGYFTDGNSLYSIDLNTAAVTLVNSFPVALSNLGLQLKIRNSSSFANYLNNHAPSRTVAYFALSSDVEKALEMASPARNGIVTFASQTTQSFGENALLNHLRERRWTLPLKQSGALLADNSENEPEVVKTNPFSTWISGFGQYATEKKQDQTIGFSTGSGGVVAAYDYVFQNSLLTFAGISAIYGNTHIHYKEGAGFADMNQGALGFYTSSEYQNIHFDGSLWAGYYSASNTRTIALPNIPSGDAKATISGWQFSPAFEVGYSRYFSWMAIEPFERLNWITCFENDFSEHGNANYLNMKQENRTCSFFQNDLGLRVQETLTYGWGELIFREKGSYMYQKSFNNTVTASLLTNPGSTFSVSTLTGAQNLGVAELEIWILPHNHRYPYGSISYEGQFGASYQANSGLLRLAIDF